MARKLKVFEAQIGRRADGTPIVKLFYGLTIKEAKDKAAAYQAGVGYQKKDITENEFYFRGWAQRWLTTYKKPFINSEAFYTTYESPVYQHLLPTFGDKLLVDISPKDVQLLYNEKAVLSKSMCGKIQMCINAIFETGIDNDKCFKNPARFCRLQSLRLPNIKEVYDDKQIKIAEQWFVSSMPEVVLVLETGVRRGEMAGWYKTDFDLRHKVHHVQRAITAQRGGDLKEGQPKSGSMRTCPLSPIAIQAYKICLERYSAGNYLITNSDGSPINPEQWSSRLKTKMAQFAKQTGLPELTAHELRHTYGTYLRRNGVDIYTIAKVLGHKSIDVTSNTYVHNEVSALRKALRFTQKQEVLLHEHSKIG